jgi:UDP:flavonoid glycosyltransferase YjiC (YdhE family)
VTDRAKRFVLCSTPAQGHTAPLLALAERLVHDGHEVVFFTTEHYRDKVIDKPEVAARVQWSGVGINLRTGKPSKAMVAPAVRRVLTHSSYRRRARALRAEIEASDPLGDITRVLGQICRDRARANGPAADN